MKRNLLLAVSFTVLLIVGGCLHAPMPWSPDGKWIAYTVEVRPTQGWLRPGWLFESPHTPSVPPPNASVLPLGYRIWASREDSSESVLLEDSPLPLTAPGWSPDGRALAFGRVSLNPDESAKFEVVILEGPNRRRVVSSRPLGVLNADASRLPGQAIAWSPDGRYLAVPQLNPLGLSILRADNGRQVNSFNDGFLPSWSPDGSKLAFYTRGTGDTLQCLDSPTGQPRLLAEVGQAGQAALWTRDGSLVVAARRTFPRGAEPPGDQVEILKVRVETGQTETIRALSNDAVLGHNRAVEGVSIAFDTQGDNLFCSTVVEGNPNQITWVRPRENHAIYKKFAVLDYSMPMGSLSLSPDGRILAARVGSLNRLSPPALCDLESPDLKSKLLAPDDGSRVEWIGTLVAAARGILGSLPSTTTDPKTASTDRLERPTLLPVPGDFESTVEQVHRLRRLGRLGKTLCERPASAPPATPEVAAILDEARFFFDYLSENYAAAFKGLEALEDRAETPDRRIRLMSLRAQLFLARGDVDRADETIRYLEKLEKKPSRRIEWTGSGYVVTATEPLPLRGWPAYLALRASALRVKLHDEGQEGHPNPDSPRANFGFGQFDPRGNPVFPNDPFLNNNLNDPPNRAMPFVVPR